MTAGKFIGASVAITAEIFLRPDADDILRFEEKAKLVGEVEVSLVVGRGGNEDDLGAIG
jgi:hypothetical protein